MYVLEENSESERFIGGVKWDSTSRDPRRYIYTLLPLCFNLSTLWINSVACVEFAHAPARSTPLSLIHVEPPMHQILASAPIALDTTVSLEMLTWACIRPRNIHVRMYRRK